MFGSKRSIVPVTVMALGAVAVLASRIFAHCDTYSGPVIVEARNALEKGDVTPLLKWVTKEDEGRIKEAFTKVLAVRKTSLQAKEIADQYFFETLVRIHREAEGAPFTGLKNTPADPVEAMTDKALETGNVDGLVKELSAHMEKEIRAKFQNAVKTRKTRDSSVDAGREYVEAYVTYLHYVTGIHDAIAAKSGHSQAPANGKTGPKEHQH